MLSGIWDLKFKRVKNSSQRFWLLFTGAQKTTDLAWELCTNGWEKGHTPFVKVVEGWLTYNYPIYHLDHFSSKIWRKTISNRAKRNSNRAGRAHARDVARDAGVAHRWGPCVVRGPVDGRFLVWWVIDNVVWTDSWLSIAGEKQTRKVVVGEASRCGEDK
jgi:hypothetical protein